MSNAAIESAFEQAIVAMSGAMPTEWPNVGFTIPAPDAPYQTVTFLHSDPVNTEYGPNHRKEGFAQILLRYPRGAGVGGINARINLIEAAFKRGRGLINGSVAVTIDRTPATSPPLYIADRYCIPVRIRYFANITAL
jgi:hypothetical protein